jgi:hypothetical protein
MKKNKFLHLILAAVLSSSVAFGNFANTYNYEDVMEDFTAQNTEKYQKDNFVKLDEKTLIEKNIINNVSQLKSQNSKDNINCNVVNATFTATIYEVNPTTGVVTCMLAKKGDLYNPIGLFDVDFPNVKTYFEKDLAAAKAANTTAVANADAQFSSLYAEKNNIFAGINQQSAAYLSIPELLLSTILTDVDIVDIQASESTNKLQLKQGYSSTIYNGNGVTDTSNQFILADAAGIFANFSSISDISMDYLLVLVLLFGGFGLLHSASKKAMSLAENKGQNYSLMPYGVGLMGGLILFFPTTDSLNSNNQVLANQYNLYQNRFMELSRSGYYLTAEWGKDVSRVIIDNEIDTLIAKSGTGTAEQIVNSYAGKEQQKKIVDLTTDLFNQCSTAIYDPDKMTSDKKDKNFYNNDINTVFPNSENFAYASSLFKSGTSSDYYNNIGSGGITKTGSSSTYPKISLSACNKIYYENEKNISLLKDYETAYNTAIANSSSSNADKLAAIKTIMSFQYGLYRDWGFLSILGLPIMKMQTESIGGLYSNPNDQIMDGLNDKIDGGGLIGGTIHDIASSVPYMMIPGISNIYTHVSKAYGDLIDGFDKSAWGMAKNFLGGGVATAVLKNSIGFTSSYIVAKTILIMLPIIALLIVGILRFIVIYIKILAFHFASLFLLPVIFILNNIDGMKSFFIKIISTMLELPLFVLAVYLAMVANNLIHSIGDVFSKRIISGMIDNNESMHKAKEWEFSDLLTMNFQTMDVMKIYFLDGLVSIAISLFAVVIIYKIITSLHTAIFELVEVKATATLDNTIDSMKNEISGNMGNKI